MQEKKCDGENKELISELSQISSEIKRFSNFSRFWSVNGFSVLSLCLTLGVAYLRVSDKILLKFFIFITFLATCEF